MLHFFSHNLSVITSVKCLLRFMISHRSRQTHCRVSVFNGQLILFCYLIGWYDRWRHNKTSQYTCELLLLLRLRAICKQIVVDAWQWIFLVHWCHNRSSNKVYELWKVWI